MKDSEVSLKMMHSTLIAGNSLERQPTQKFVERLKEENKHIIKTALIKYQVLSQRTLGVFKKMSLELLPL